MSVSFTFKMWLVENLKLHTWLRCDLHWAALLHWLPIALRFKSKFLTMTIKALCDLTSASLSGLHVGYIMFG